MKTRKDLMNRLNELLNVNYNWSRLNSLDLERLVTAIDQLDQLINKFARAGLVTASAIRKKTYKRK